MNQNPVVIIACGAKKRTHAAPASDLYIGPYFRACLRYARSIAADEDIFILSLENLATSYVPNYPSEAGSSN